MLEKDPQKRGGKSRCELVIEAMGGEGLWDEEINQQLIDQTRTWTEADWGGYWQSYCLEEGEYRCERYDET